MAKKKVKTVKKTKAPKKKAVKKARAPKKKAVKKIKSKEKVLGKLTHYFDKISVAIIKVKNPFKVGDVIHIKGHTTDFVQRIESMQLEHENILKAKKGDEIGIKVKDYVRDHDIAYLGKESDLVKPQPSPKIV